MTTEQDRTPRDGKPFYCVKCNCGFSEYMACELPDCELESEASAEMRKLFIDSDLDEVHMVRGDDSGSY